MINNINHPIFLFFLSIIIMKIETEKKLYRMKEIWCQKITKRMGKLINLQKTKIQKKDNHVIYMKENIYILLLILYIYL